MPLYLVRHAHAVQRAGWDGPDRERPLSAKGSQQAKALVSLLDRAKRILSSPAARCVQTVQPLAEHLGVSIEETPVLAEGASVDAALALVTALLHDEAVLCAHGDLIPVLLAHFAANGAQLDGLQPTAKGSVWVVESEHARVTRARYLPPPSTSS